MTTPSMGASIGWLGIIRLGLVQAALGAVVVLTTSTLNRVMVVEWQLPATLPGALVALHYAVQVLRPRFGYGADAGGRRTPWIIAGMAALALGGTAAASATALMGANLFAGLALALAAFTLVGLGVGCAGTSVLTLLAARVDAARRAPAATILWLMMIAGIVLASATASRLLDPFTPTRLIAVVTAAAAIAFAVSILAVWRIEPVIAGEAKQPGATRPAPTRSPSLAPAKRLGNDGTPPGQPTFLATLRQTWREPASRRFALFVFTAMLAYSAQEVVLEPFAGAVFHLTPGATAGLTGLHHAGILAGMALVATASALTGGFRARTMRAWTMGGCAASALAMAGMAAIALAGPGHPLNAAVIALGIANGAFAVSAIAAMMGLAAHGREGREGTRIGLWGAAQALAFAAGGLFGTGLIDAARLLLGAPGPAYAAVFAAQAAVFLLAARLAAGVFHSPSQAAPAGLPAAA